MKPKRRRKKPVEEPREQQVVFETVSGDPQEDETDEAVPSDYTLTQTDDSAAQQLRYDRSLSRASSLRSEKGASKKPGGPAGLSWR